MASIKRVEFRIAVFLLFTTLLLQASCISYRKRPTRLFQQAKEKGLIFDAAIVPGYPYDGSKWDTVVKGRVLWASYLYKTGWVRNLIFSGSAVYTPYYEAKVMGLYALKLGIPAEHIFYDTVARHSTENIFYSYEVARKQGFKSIALVTDPFQSSLTKRFTKRRFGTPIYHLPFLVDTLKSLNGTDPEIDASSAYKKNFVSIKENSRFIKRLSGTLGFHIPWNGKKRRKADPL